MQLDSLTAISPLDGRYRNRLTPLAELVSELALQRYRVRIELRWFEHLADERTVSELPALSAAARKLLRTIDADFSATDGASIKEIERTTNHDVKAVEYFVKEKLARFVGARSAHRIRSFRVHLGRHQQSRARAHAEGGARRSHPAADATADRCDKRKRCCVRGCCDVEPYARASGLSDHDGQGTGQCRESVSNGSVTHFEKWRSSANSTVRSATSMHTLPLIRQWIGQPCRAPSFSRWVLATTCIPRRSNRTTTSRSTSMHFPLQPGAAGLQS